MELETIRIELPNGWASVYKEVLRKTARLHEAELRKYMRPVDATTGTVLQSELEANPAGNYKVDYEVDLVALDANQDKINEIFILNQTMEWSFGPVDLETLDRCLTSTQYKLLVKELNELYKPNPLAASA